MNWEKFKYNFRKARHKAKVARRFRKLGIPKKECQVCERGIVEWIGAYQHSQNIYNVCDFCKIEMGGRFVAKRYEPIYMIKIEKDVIGK